MRPTERTIEHFKLWASPVILIIGLLWGVIFLLLGIEPQITHSRVLLSLLFITGSLLAFCYTEPRATKSQTLPLMVEMLRYFFFFWFLFGVVWALRLVGDDPPPQDKWVLYAISFLVGSIAGSVWGLGLLLFLGRKTDIAAWEVVRFPVWTVGMRDWIKRRLRRD